MILTADEALRAQLRGQRTSVQVTVCAKTRILRQVVVVEQRLITWAQGVLGAGIESVRGLRDGGPPWLLETGRTSAVMRVGTADEVAALRVEEAGLELAATSGVPVPRVLAAEFSGDPAALLVELMPGSSAIPSERAPLRLRAARSRSKSTPPIGRSRRGSPAAAGTATECNAAAAAPSGTASD